MSDSPPPSSFLRNPWLLGALIGLALLLALACLVALALGVYLIAQTQPWEITPVDQAGNPAPASIRQPRLVVVAPDASLVARWPQNCRSRL